MITKISRWGNSLGIRIPKPIVENLHLNIGSEVVVNQENGTIVIKPTNSDTAPMDELIFGMTEDGLMDQFEDYPEIGKEIIE